MSISAFLIVLNEEKKIVRTLESLKWADEIVIVDGGSIDHTVNLCKENGAKVFNRPFDNFANQKNYAVSLTQHEWVFSIDADEIVTKELAEEIKQAATPDNPHNAYQMKRINYFLGKRLRFGSQGSEWVLRIFRKKSAKFKGIIHETVQSEGKVGKLNHSLLHYSTETLKDYSKKLDLYVALEVRQMMETQNFPSLFKILFSPPAKWVKDYVLLGGLLDGQTGLLYHSLSCYYNWLKNFKGYFAKQKFANNIPHGIK